MITVACNVPLDEYFTTESVFDSPTVPHREDVTAQEIIDGQTTVTMTFKPTTVKAPIQIPDYKTTNAPQQNNKLADAKNMSDEQMPNNVNSSHSVDNGLSRGHAKAHLVRLKKKQKTEIKANIDETDKHVVSDFEVIETYEEEEEWVDGLNQGSQSDGKPGGTFIKRHPKQQFTHGDDEHKVMLPDTHSAISSPTSNPMSTTHHKLSYDNKHAHSKYSYIETTTLVQGASNKKMKQASSHAKVNASRSSFCAVSVDFLIFTLISWNMFIWKIINYESW